ncbi:MAG: hypothetical protein ACREDM_08255 [Methylocella sp.]
MPTLDELCADMAASGRYLTPRAARDWWTKGLLPQPRRHGLGRGKGTETFWTEPGIIERAQAAYDLLAAQPRVDTAILGLWLWGFPTELASIRAVYGRLMSRHFSSIRGRSMLHFGDAVGELAGQFARKIALPNAPKEAKNAIADLTSEFLGIFYGVNEELAATGLGALWKKATPYFGNNISQSGSLADIDLRDDHFEIMARYLNEMASLTAQRKAITSATDYELIRARRLVHLFFGYLGRLARAAERGKEFEEFGRRLLIELGRPAVPILITVLREDSLRHKTLSFILDLMPRLRQMTLGYSTKVRIGSKCDVRASDR